MSMQAFILSEHTASMPVGPIVSQAAKGAVEVRDTDGNVVAFVISPFDREALTYLEAYRDFEENREQIRQASQRRGGVSTQELLERAHAAAAQATDES